MARSGMKRSPRTSTNLAVILARAQLLRVMCPDYIMSSCWLVCQMVHVLELAIFRGSGCCPRRLKVTDAPDGWPN